MATPSTHVPVEVALFFDGKYPNQLTRISGGDPFSIGVLVGQRQVVEDLIRCAESTNEVQLEVTRVPRPRPETTRPGGGPPATAPSPARSQNPTRPIEGRKSL